MSSQDQAAEATISDETELATLREGIDDPMILKDQLRKEADARRQLTARAKKAEEELRALKAQGIKAEPVINQPSTDSPVTLNDEVVDLRLDGYSKQEVSFLADFAKARGTTLNKALEDPYVKSAIDAQRTQTKAEQAASQVADTSGLSEIERKYTPEQLRNMSVKELEALLPRNS